MNDLLVKHPGQKEIAISSIPGIKFLGLTRAAPSPATNYQTYPTIDGERQYGDYALGPLTMNANFWMRNLDGNEREIKQQEIYDLLFDRKLIQVRETVLPGIVADCVIQTFNLDILDELSVNRKFTVPLEVPSGYRHSFYRSDNPLLWSQENYQFGMNLRMDEASHQYAFKAKNFEVFNPSSIPIQPYEQNHDLVITFKGSGSPTITNQTTGTKFSFKKELSSSDELKLDGVDALLNGSYCGQDTDWGVISLARGMNQITVTGCTVDQIKFSFPFIYV